MVTMVAVFTSAYTHGRHRMVAVITSAYTHGHENRQM
jgi:glycerol dehydrogenase-like iron-containing ADH family enzyme